MAWARLISPVKPPGLVGNDNKPKEGINFCMGILVEHLLGLLTIYSGGKVATAFLVLGVPLLDFVIVIARRLGKGRNPLRGNAVDEHLHHRLLLKGWSRGSIIALTAGIGTVFGISALFMDTAQKFMAAVLLFVLMLMLSLYSRPKTVTG